MKYLITFVFSICFLATTKAQQKSNTDPSLKFDQRFSRCERKWVVLSKRDSAQTYSYGYIYIDEGAGFTFDLQGVFKVADDGKYIKDTLIFKNTGSIKYRIAPNWQLVALLPPQHFDELKIKPEPDWVKIYYTYTDSLKYNSRLGWLYNDLGECATALTYLERVYKVKPHYPGVEFEMAFAYNALERFDEAIKLIEPAIPNDPNNAYFYKELAYAYSHKKLFQKAIDTYKRGLEHMPAEPSDAKGELALNMAYAYKNLGNEDEYKNWMIKGKSYTPTTSQYYKMYIDAGF